MFICVSWLTEDWLCGPRAARAAIAAVKSCMFEIKSVTMLVVP